MGAVVTIDALRTLAETARHLAEDKHAHYLMIIKGNLPGLLYQMAAQKVARRFGAPNLAPPCLVTLA